MSKEAMRLALEALERLALPKNADDIFRQAITALREALAKPDFWEGYVPEPDNTCNNALREQGKAYPRTCKKCGLGPCVELAQQALDKKAENAKEIGLDYEPARDSGIVTAGGADPRTQRTWVGLTLEDMETTHWSPDFRAGAKWAAAKLKEKNNG